ncbi:MAG: acyl-CoA dehydrogenase [Planctomycetota bacterium]|nr:MAG: acyl-CoA dehydrogenase [Planctomycetota bacterium]
MNATDPLRHGSVMKNSASIAKPHDSATERRLSPDEAFAAARTELQALVRYAPRSMWEQDTAALPLPLQYLRRHARHFAARELAPRALDTDLAPHDRDVERQVLRSALQAGLFFNSVPHPEEGRPLPLDDYPLAWTASLKNEELAAGCGGWALMLAAHALGATPLVLCGDAATLARVMEKAKAKGRAGEPYLLAYAITEPASGSDVEETRGAAVARPGTIARPSEGGWRLTGRKLYTSGGDIADAVMVFAALEGEGLESWTCFLVERDTPGFTRVRNEVKMGQRASAATELLLEDVFVPDEHVIGELREGWALNRASLNLSRIPVAALALGIARGAVEAAIEFVACFELGGRPLLEYQEVELQVAEMIAQLSMMRSTIWEYARRPIPTQAAASLAKVSCSDAALQVCTSAMQLLSNHGVLHRERVEKAWRDVRLTQIYEGTNDINRLAIIEDLRQSLAGDGGV